MNADERAAAIARLKAENAIAYARIRETVRRHEEFNRRFAEACRYWAEAMAAPWRALADEIRRDMR